MSSIRHILIANIALRKWGAYERWLLAWAERLNAEGERLEIWTVEPTLPEVADRLDAAGVERNQLQDYRGTRRIRGVRSVIYVSFMGITDRPMRYALASWGVPLVIYDRTSGTAGSPGLLRQIWRAGIGLLLRRRVSRVVGNSGFVVERDRQVWGFSDSQVEVIYNSADHPPSWQVRNNPTCELLCVAYLIPAKGVDTLIAAVATLTDLPWRLRVVGDGPERDNLETQCSKLGLSQRVEFLGHRNDVPQLQQSADIIIHPARWAEACANTILEGMGAGAAMVVSATGGSPELVEEGVSGLLFPPDNSAALAEALRGLIQDPRLREAMGRAGRERVATRFSRAAQFQALLALGRATAR